MTTSFLPRIWLLTLLLSGCATIQESSDPESVSRWQARQVVLQGLHNWEFSGRIAIQYEAEGWFATIRWQQRGPNYQIQISGPAGQGAMRLQGNATAVTLVNNNNVYHAARPEDLLATHLGWQVPVGNLRYWICGLPAPASTLDLQEFDQAGHLLRLRQDGWQIHFDRYTTIMNSLELPGRLDITYPSLIIRIIIERWDLH